MARNMMANLRAIAADTYTSDIKMIDISELHDSPDNFFEIERLEEFADTILGQGGVKDNLVVRPLDTGGYEIISGHRRKAAVQLLIDRGETISRFLPCLVQKYIDDNDRKLDLIFMNVSTRKLSDAELYKSYEIVNDILTKKKDAGEKFGKIRETLAGYFGISPSKVGQMQNVQKYATPEIKAAIDNGDMSISTANQIARLSNKEQAEFASKANSDNIKLKDVKAKVDTNVNYPDISNAKKVDTNVKFPDNGNTENKKTINISDPFIVDLVEKLIERMYVRDVYNYETCGKPEWMCPEKNSAEHMVGLSIFSYAKEHFPDLFPDDE